jgi:hypothetical protein
VSLAAIDLAQAAVFAMEAYLAGGLLFAMVFLTRGVSTLDLRIIGAPITLRLLILPGVIALWPLFARRWAAGANQPTEQNAHRARAHGTVR